MSSKNGEEPLLKKKKPSIESNSISSLPDDLIVSCLARVSRLYYPILSLVSKKFRSLLASSPELYQTRKLLNHTESCLYVCLKFPPHLTPRWFTLSKKPNQTLTNNNDNKKKNKNKKKRENSNGCGYVLAPVLILSSPILEWPNLVSVGSHLYAISEKFENTAPCCNIFALDCRNHNWLETPSMRIAQTDSDIDGMLYLPGSDEDTESLKSIEVFNTETQTWNHLPGKSKQLSKLSDMEGKIYMSIDLQSGKRRLAYKPKESTWETVGEDDRWNSMCIIGSISYHYNASVGFEWSDGKSDFRKKLKGLDGLPKFAGYSNVKLAEYGGKMIVLWDKYVPVRRKYKEKMIWCAEISLNNNGE